LPYLQTSIEKTFYRKYNPHSAITIDGPIEWLIYPMDEHYIDLNQSFISIEWYITDKNDKPLKPSVKNEEGKSEANALYYVMPINYFGATCFKQIQFFLNNSTVEGLDNLYGYKSYIQAILDYGRNVKQQELKMGLFTLDNPPLEATTEEQIASNKGTQYRFDKTKGSRHFQTISRIQIGDHYTGVIIEH
jgi:hypothetical protein